MFSWTQCFLSCLPRCLENDLQNLFVIISQEFFGQLWQGGRWASPFATHQHCLSPPCLSVTSLLAGWTRGPRALSPSHCCAHSGLVRTNERIRTRLFFPKQKAASSWLQWAGGGGWGHGGRLAILNSAREWLGLPQRGQEPAHQLSVHLPTGHRQESRQTPASPSPRKDSLSPWPCSSLLPIGT